MRSPFLDIATSEWVASNRLAFAIRDRFPVTRGHTLIVPRRLIATWFDATREEQAAIFELVDEVKRALDHEFAPAGYNVGFNAGAAAGQTVMHLHVHVIPRYEGDVPDPRGGVRHVIPGRGNYLLPRADEPDRDIRDAPLSVGGAGDPFYAHVRPLFRGASEIAIVAAFVRRGGVALLRRAIEDALARGARLRLITGDYLRLTDPEALSALLDLAGLGANDEPDADGAAVDAGDGDDARSGTLAVRVIEVDAVRATLGASFHPKSWRFESRERGIAFVGSSNLSRTALRDGVEWNLRVERERDPVAFARVTDEFDRLWELATPARRCVGRDVRSARRAGAARGVAR